MATASPKPKAAVRAFATASMAGRATIVPNHNFTVSHSALSMAFALLVSAFAIRAGRATIVPHNVTPRSALFMAPAFLVSASALKGFLVRIVPWGVQSDNTSKLRALVMVSAYSPKTAKILFATATSPFSVRVVHIQEDVP